MQNNTLLEDVEKYLHWKSTYTSRAPVNYRPWLIRLAASVGDKKLTEITLADIGKFRNSIDRKYQPYTVQLAMVCIHNFFKFWSVQGINCLAPTLIRVPKTRARSRAFVSQEDLDKILAYFKGRGAFSDMRDELIIRLLWDTGLRISELCDINHADINIEKREVLVRTRKSDRMRQVFWSPETNALLLKYLEIRKPLSTSGALFIGINPWSATCRFRARSIQRKITEIVGTLNLGKNITPHSFRHGKAHRILRMGGNPKHVQAILGHSPTNPYASFQYLQYDDKELSTTAHRFLGEDTTSEGISNTSQK